MSDSATHTAASEEPKPSLDIEGVRQDTELESLASSIATALGAVLQLRVPTSMKAKGTIMTAYSGYPDPSCRYLFTTGINKGMQRRIASQLDTDGYAVMLGEGQDGPSGKSASIYRRGMKKDWAVPCPSWSVAHGLASSIFTLDSGEFSTTPSFQLSGIRGEDYKTATKAIASAMRTSIKLSTEDILRGKVRTSTAKPKSSNINSLFRDVRPSLTGQSGYPDKRYLFTTGVARNRQQAIAVHLAMAGFPVMLGEGTDASYTKNATIYCINDKRSGVTSEAVSIPDSSKWRFAHQLADPAGKVILLLDAKGNDNLWEDK